MRLVPLVTLVTVFILLWGPVQFRGAQAALMVPALIYLGAIVFRLLLATTCRLASCITSRDFAAAQNPILAPFQAEADARNVTDETALELLAAHMAADPARFLRDPPSWRRPNSFFQKHLWEPAFGMGALVVLSGQ
jgi:hypothetical protein